jgi:hypothetical protein
MPPTAATAAATRSLPVAERAARAPMAAVRTGSSGQAKSDTISRTPPQLMSTIPLLSVRRRVRKMDHLLCEWANATDMHHDQPIWQ